MRHKPFNSCMIWLFRPDQTEATEFAPGMAEGTRGLPGLSAVAGKPVHVGFDGGRLTSDAGILLLSTVEKRLKIGGDWRPASKTRASRIGCGTNSPR